MIYVQGEWWYENKREKYLYVEVARVMYGVQVALKLRKMFDDLGYVKCYTDLDRDVVYFCKKWFCPFFRFYHWLRFKRWKVMVWLRRKRIILIKEGDHIKNWKFNWYRNT